MRFSLIVHKLVSFPAPEGWSFANVKFAAVVITAAPSSVYACPEWTSFHHRDARTPFASSLRVSTTPPIEKLCEWSVPCDVAANFKFPFAKKGHFHHCG